MSRQGHAAHADAQHGRAVKTRQELLMVAVTDLTCRNTAKKSGEEVARRMHAAELEQGESRYYQEAC